LEELCAIALPQRRAKVYTKFHEELIINNVNKSKLLIILFLVAGLSSCERKSESKSKSPLNGNWAFLDIRGNYNEAFFTDSNYITYNMVYGLSPVFNYFIKNDSLYSNIDKRKKGLHRIAKIKWLTADSAILTTEFSKDTLGRLMNAGITLENTNPQKDSILFRQEIYGRYETFLLSKGILSREEFESFKKDNKVPEDVLKGN